MSYDISLCKVPVELIKGQYINEEVLFDIAYTEEYENCILAYTNFSKGNSESTDFARVFNIVLTNNDFFKIYTLSDYNEAKNRLQAMSLDDELLERVNEFLNIIEYELNKGETIFFNCS